MAVITLLSDFGTRDWFVPSMKGVILSIAPGAQIVDMTHDIPAHNIRAGSFVLSAAARMFPPGTIHVAVVDPGVGSERKAIAVRTHGYLFLAPDNGLLSLALAQERIVEIRSIENSRLFRQPVSHTFHGRDVFASVAAYLANGIEFSSLGPVTNSAYRIEGARPAATADGIAGEVIFVDRFGNVITNISRELLAGVRVRHVELGNQLIASVSDSYSRVPPGSPVAVINSLGLLEIGIRDGSAAERLPAKIGSRVQVGIGD